MSQALSIASAEKGVLMVVDIQDRLLSAMPQEQQQQIQKTMQTLLAAADALALPVLVTEQYPKGLGHTVAGIQEALPANTPTFEKTHFSAWQVDAIADALKQSGYQQVFLSGMETHICVLQTALDLLKQGFEVFVIEEAVCSRDNKNYLNALTRLREAGAVITNIESLLFECIGDARHPQFKTISKLII
ncbi:isochorismatase family protein [Methylophaga sulfidovorans]|uniref:Nicotinamidase-related amidase n=1 Tax=Methylophaga sulfidovorans TaxID=45496 RepID=A0A1I3U3G4_9GAMM|nr:isochorismatase family protein [Methylophaga sulfidovorans]SFJ76331.1 Nicotinamidase-related amidase [Methylophaga sulfidovorans]